MSGWAPEREPGSARHTARRPQARAAEQGTGGGGDQAGGRRGAGWSPSRGVAASGTIAASPHQAGVVRLTRRSFHGRGVSRPSEARASGTVGSSRQPGMNPGQLGWGRTPVASPTTPGGPMFRPHRGSGPTAWGRGAGDPTGWRPYHDATGTSVQGGVGAGPAGRAVEPFPCMRGRPFCVGCRRGAGASPKRVTPSLAPCAPEAPAPSGDPVTRSP